MKFVFQAIAVAATLALANPVAEAESYLCALDALTGFVSTDGSHWTQTAFTADQKFVIARVQDKNYAWTVTETGMSLPSSFCTHDFEGDSLSCDGLAQIRFNKAILKFTYAYQTDFWVPSEARKQLKMKPGGSIALGIGKCTTLQ